MNGRLALELSLLRTRFPDLRFDEVGRWVLLPTYPLPPGWSASETRIAFPIQTGHPATPPYGLCIPEDLRFKDAVPGNSSSPASVPFPGAWRQMSWAPESWQPAAEPQNGSNLVQWALGFSQRFNEGA
jgi:hypothetical protein